MFTVYKITNQINQKCYIGSSIRVNKRWQEHKRVAFNPNDQKYNYPLYQAFRKYGLENFIFEILKDDFNTQEEMSKYEQQMIIFYNSVNNGYNQTYCTNIRDLSKENCFLHIQEIKQKCAKIDINNNIIETYSSYHEAAEKNGYEADSRASNIRRVCKGLQGSLNGEIFRDLDINNNIIDIKMPTHFHGKKKIVGINIDTQDEIFFESITDAAYQLQIPRQSLSKCINGDPRYSIVHNYIWREISCEGDIIENNIVIQTRINQYNNERPLINGERHTIKEWCTIYNLTPTSYYKRRKKGLSVIDAITKPKKG